MKTPPNNPRSVALLDEAYETNNVDYQLFFATQLIGEIIVELETATKLLHQKQTAVGTHTIESVRDKLQAFYSDAQFHSPRF